MSTFAVPDMSCGHCSATIRKTVQTADPAARLEIDLTEKRISLDSAKLDEVLAALADEGYPATPA